MNRFHFMHVFTRRFVGPALFLFCAVALNAAPKIGVLLKGKSEFWAAMEKGASEAGEKLGVEVVIKAPASESDIAIQIQLLNALAAQGVSAIVIAPCSAESLVEPLAAVAAKGIKIVVVDSPLAGKTPYVFVGTDQKAAGQAAGKLLAGLVQPQDEVAIFKHSQTSAAAVQREAGALEMLRETHPKIGVRADIYASSEKNVEKERAELLLTKYPNTKAIFASATPGTLAMATVLKEKALNGSIKFVGCGFNLRASVVEDIQSGTITGWIAQLPQLVGYQGVETAARLLKGETVAEKVSVDFMVITQGNLADPKVLALLK